MAEAVAPERPSSPAEPARTQRGGTAALVVGCGLAVAVVLWLVAAEGEVRYTITGDHYPGALTAYGATVGRLIGTLAAAVTFGSIGYALLRTKPQDSGELGLRGYVTQVYARHYATLWAIVCVPMIFFAASESAGQDLIATYQVGGLGVLVSASDAARGWIVSLICAVIVLVALRTALSWTAHLWILLLAGVGMLATVVTANEAQGPGHDYSTGALVSFAVAGSLWVGGLWAAARLPGRPERRWIGPAFAAVLLANGLVLTLVYLPGSDIWFTWYGWLYLATAALIVAAATAQYFRAIPVAALLATASIGTAVSASLLTPPTFLRAQFTVGEVFMGFDLPDPPSVTTLATVWRVDLTFAPLVAVLVIGYLLLARRVTNWPWYRTVCFLVGALALLVITSSGIGAYAKALFSVHMVSHMLMTSLVPVFLLLGAPITLLQQTLRGAPARWLELVLESTSFAVLMRPVVQLSMFALMLYGVYLTPVFDVLGRYHWGHIAINLVLLVTGFLFYWRVFQIDPVPSQLPFIGRIGMLLAMMPISMVFALIVMTMDGLVGSRLYFYLDLPWMDDLQRDQFVGGVAAWAVDEAAIALVTVGLVLHWAWRNSKDESEPELL